MKTQAGAKFPDAGGPNDIRATRPIQDPAGPGKRLEGYFFDCPGSRRHRERRARLDRVAEGT